MRNEQVFRRRLLNNLRHGFDFIDVPSGLTFQLVPFLDRCACGIQNLHRSIESDGCLHHTVVKLGQVGFSSVTALWLTASGFPEHLTMDMASVCQEHSSLRMKKPTHFSSLARSSEITLSYSVPSGETTKITLFR